SMAGDYYETLIYVEDDEEAILDYLKKNIIADHISLCKGKKAVFIEIKARQFLDKEILSQLCSTFKIPMVKELKPVLPVLSGKDMEVPFITCQEMLEYNEDRGLDLWQLAVDYERARGNIPAGEVFAKMKNIVRIMKKSILAGIKGTRYEDRILGYQSGFFKKQMHENRLLDGGMLNQMILYTTALMEVKSSMGVIVACPTAGSCAALPGACIGAADAMGLSEDEITKAMLAAGMMGIFISAQATFAAEVGGCQAECGAASGMAAAALVILGKGDTKQAIDAASLALQNIFGMVCDPVANRVEVPCLGKNVMAAANALACANMALAHFDAVMPLDEVIEAMDKVGKSIPFELRCTALGGLSVTKTSKRIEEKLKKGKIGII
nr:serine dehydratase [Candidatus Aminicenantes bacterium]NIM82695.1 serine dehydratase [Candidatus Aminicenantes bacterium]NIN22068.1 serine dehydratase [Candidatus Aminicenantes bacterium]NIN45825.1 serine dehydratase [Candidatus Aminicenantes bacterium]NIN88663.1 serine dehydratase [Candidatus Aminicenantes bacterium]